MSTRTNSRVAMCVLALAASFGPACSSPDSTRDSGTDGAAESGGCVPACRTGFVCIAATCVSACNPACASGETCTADGTCVVDHSDAGLDASQGDGAIDDVMDASDGNTNDSNPSDGNTDGSTTDGGTSCPTGQVLCGGACRAPTLPMVQRTSVVHVNFSLTTIGDASFAVDPCTGDIGVAYVQQLSTDRLNSEVYFVVLPGAGGAMRGPTRVTMAPGIAQDTEVVFAGDRYQVFFSDARHDPNPESCGRYCVLELYDVALDANAAVVVPEARLTTHTDGYAIAPRANFDPASSTTGLVWQDSTTERQIRSAVIRRDGTATHEQVLSALATGRTANTARLRWNGARWVVMYRDDDPSAGRPDYAHTRTFAPDGTMGDDLDLMYSSEAIEFALRSDGVTTFSASGGSGATLRFFDASWHLTTTLAESSASSNDGTWGFEFDGSSYWLTTNQHYPMFTLDRFNALGVASGSITLGPDGTSSRAANVRIERVGTRFVVSWLAPTAAGGSDVNQWVTVVDASSAQ